MAGNLTVESCGSWFAQPAAQSSSNYGIGTDGRIALYVDESNRSWCSSSPANDNQAITIEVANSVAADPWPVSDKAYASLIDLCVDICRRNSITSLIYDGTTNGNLTTHDMFKSKVCPGPYLKGKMPEIARFVNAGLAGVALPAVNESAAYIVHVESNSLNIRIGPGTNYPIVDIIKNQGNYTIAEEKAGQGASMWGWLKSGAGWISLDFTSKA